MQLLKELTRAGSAAPALKWWQGWGPPLLTPCVVLLFAPSTWPRWAIMWALASSIYGSCKWLTWRRTPIHGVPLWRHVGYLFAWPGLDAAAFLNPHSTSPLRSPARGEWLFALGKSALGIWLLFGGARLVSPQYPYLVGWVGMIGIVLILHFGIFHLLSCGWRSVGVEARQLMDWPLASVSVSEFWGRRWNTAFRDLTHRFVFRPFTRPFGPRWAILAGFLFSGLVHDLVISVPAGGGYGGPSFFFLLQGTAIVVERSTLGRRIGLGQRWSGWLFTLLVLVPPAYCLFHPPFVGRIVVPFMRVLRAI